MYEVAVERSFSAAHALRGYRGKDEPLHGHNWRVEVTVATAILAQDGTAVDFVLLSEALDRVLAGLDHANLNELPPFSPSGEGINPSAENLARYIFERLSPSFRPTRVRVWETEGCSASYLPE